MSWHKREFEPSTPAPARSHRLSFQIPQGCNKLVRSVLLPGIRDTQCGFKVFRAEAARAIFSRTREDGWAYDLEVLALAREFGLRVVEVPIDWRHNRDSRVRPFMDAPGMVAALFRIRARIANTASFGPVFEPQDFSDQLPRV